MDFFQIEYYEEHDPVGTVQMSAKINKNRKSFDIPIKPCSDYRFKVIFKYEFNLKSTNMIYFELFEGDCFRRLEGNERGFQNSFRNNGVQA